MYINGLNEITSSGFGLVMVKTPEEVPDVSLIIIRVFFRKKHNRRTSYKEHNKSAR